MLFFHILDIIVLGHILSLSYITMKVIKIKKRKEKKLIWTKFRHYIGLMILACCIIIGKNLISNHIYNAQLVNNTEMVYIFHDFEWNEYVLNDKQHGAADSFDYLFNNEVPEIVKNKDKANSVSLADWDIKMEESSDDSSLTIEINNESDIYDRELKDNQLSIDEIFENLNIEDYEIREINNDNQHNDTNEEVIINVWNSSEWDQDDELFVVEEWNNELIIENSRYKKNPVKGPLILQTNEIFHIINHMIIPTLIPREDIDTRNYGIQWYTYELDPNYLGDWTSSWINIIADYNDCLTPRWYKIVHWDSVLAYKQIDQNLNICNIERRFCRNGKLSGTYTQQWCYSSSVEYSQQSDIKYEYDYRPNDSNTKDNNSIIKEKNNSTKTKVKPLWTGSIAFERPSRASTPTYWYIDNIVEYEEVEQTSRPKWNCTTPRWEEVTHWQFIQAFKHANWFNDAPCETQLRLCSMWNLMWTYNESSCKNRDTSFIDRINGSPTRETYSKEKIERIKKLIEYEEFYDRDLKRFTNSEALDKIMKILDE